MQSVAEFQKRFCRRVIADLPADLEAMECEDPLGILRHHVRRLLGRTARQTDRRPAYASHSSFSIPGSPPTSRLQSAEGYIPFHFAKNEVEARTAKEFDAYASGKGPIVPADLQPGRPVEIAASIDGAGRDAYMESHGGLAGAAPDRWTNLADDTALRGEQWATIEAFERNSRVNPDGNSPGLSFFYDRAPMLFDDVAAQPACPAGLRTLIAKQQARVVSGTPLSKRKARDGVRWVDERAFDVYDWIKSRPDWPEGAGKADRPVRVSQGRAVQTHLAGEGEYHAALGIEARSRIRHGMINVVQRQHNPTSATDAGWFVPMTICDHRPDGLNDPLNDHFHWLVGTRRARFKEDGGLEFEDRKVDAITRYGWLDVMREELARLANAELERIGASVRYHPGTLAEMGIDAPAQQKMGGRRTVLERAGFSTELGLSNDTEGWRRAFATAQRNHDAILVAIEQGPPEHDEQVAMMRAAKIAAAEFRYEAAQIQILIDMSRSRAKTTARFAGEYAGAASSPRVIDGWLSRGRDAERYLRQLDVDLADERMGVAERLAKADRLDVEIATQIAAHRASPVDFGPELSSLAMKPGGSDPRSHNRDTVQSKSDVHRMVDHIARAPLYISELDGIFHVAASDDPDRLLEGIDLSAVQRRLAGIQQAQQRELAQVQAFARRHGGAALFDDDCETHTAWFLGAMRKWRDAPVMERWLQEQDAKRARAQETEISARVARRGRHGHKLIDLVSLGALSSLDEIPFLDEISGYRSRRSEIEITAGAALPALPIPAPRVTVQPSPSTPPDGPAIPQSAGLRWSALEQRHREYVESQATRARAEIDLSIEAAFVQRTGGRNAITPYSARLLQQIEKGFDPLNVPAKIGSAGRTLAQKDAPEILLLLREPAFRARVDAAKRQELVLSANLVEILRTSVQPDFLGTVGIVNGRLQFGSATNDVQSQRDTPLRWAERTIGLVVKDGLPLTRHNGLVGVYDDEVLRASHYNYVGLLHPSIQLELDLEQRIQTEHVLALLAKVQAGTLKVETRISQIERCERIVTYASLLNGTADEQRLVFHRRYDAAFYFQCREAEFDGPATLSPLRHESAIVRAWLRARDDPASPQVIGLLAQKLRADSRGLSVGGMSTIDAQALTAILASPTFVPARAKHQRGGHRGRLPNQPGRGHNR